MALNCGTPVVDVIFDRTPCVAFPKAVVIAVDPVPVTTPERVMDWLAVRQPVQVRAKVFPCDIEAAPPSGAAVVTVKRFPEI